MFFRLLGTLTLVVLAAACVGESSSGREERPDPEPVSDDPLDDGESSSCSAAGVAAECDPVAISGCSEGSCYLVRDQGPSCVCPAGSAAPGEACNTSIECAPGSVCAGTVAPGVCRETCTEDEDCPLGFFCLTINGMEPHGYCEPVEAGGQ